MLKKELPFSDCQTEKEKAEHKTVVENAYIDFSANSSGYGCPLSCLSISFDMRVNYFSEALDFEDGLKMYPYYDSSAVEKQSEVLVYDIPKFLSAIGGTLGLYLGFSCLSILWSALKAYQKCGKRKVSDMSANSKTVNI